VGADMRQTFAARRPADVTEAGEAVVAAGKERSGPELMTSATTIHALLPVMTSQGRGSDVMLPMAIPSFGGMVVALITVFVVPTLWSLGWELTLRKRVEADTRSEEHTSEL